MDRNQPQVVAKRKIEPGTIGAIVIITGLVLSGIIVRLVYLSLSNNKDTSSPTGSQKPSRKRNREGADAKRSQ